MFTADLSTNLDPFHYRSHPLLNNDLLSRYWKRKLSKPFRYAVGARQRSKETSVTVLYIYIGSFMS